MQLETCREAHDSSAFLGMQSPGKTIHQVHSSLCPHSTTEGGQGYGMALHAVNAFTLTTLGNGAYPQGAKCSLGRHLSGQESVRTINVKFLESGSIGRQENVLESDVLIGRFGKGELGEPEAFAETNEVDALSFLRHAVP